MKDIEFELWVCVSVASQTGRRGLSLTLRVRFRIAQLVHFCTRSLECVKSFFVPLGLGPDGVNRSRRADYFTRINNVVKAQDEINFIMISAQ